MKRKFLSLLSALIIAVSFLSPAVQEFTGMSVSAEAASVNVPKASRKSGTYKLSGTYMSVKLTAEDGAKIYYSLNDGEYKLYSKAIRIKKNSTLSFYSKKNGKKSKTVTCEYKLKAKVTLKKDGNSVTLSTKNEDVKIYYTTDGSKPTKKSKLYEGGKISVKNVEKLRYVAVRSSWSSAYYTYNIKKTSTKASAKESIADNYKEKFGYQNLSDTHKKFYTALYNSAVNFQTFVDVSSLNVRCDEFDRIFFAFYLDNPQLFWLKNYSSYQYYDEYIVAIVPEYRMTKAQAEKLEAKIEKERDEILKNAEKYDNDFDKAVYFHNEVALRTKYNLNGDLSIRNIDGVFVNGSALCEGYSSAFVYLCQSAGINACMVEGVASGEDHNWSFAELDGEWYQFDTTHDDVEKDNLISCYYIGLNDKDMRADDRNWHNFGAPVPKADGEKYNYLESKGIPVYKNSDKALEALVDAAVESCKNREKYAYIYCDPSISDKVFRMFNETGFNQLDARTDYDGYVNYGYSGALVYVEFLY